MRVPGGTSGGRLPAAWQHLFEGIHPDTQYGELFAKVL